MNRQYRSGASPSQHATVQEKNQVFRERLYVTKDCIPDISATINGSYDIEEKIAVPIQYGCAAVASMLRRMLAGTTGRNTILRC